MPRALSGGEETAIKKQTIKATLLFEAFLPAPEGNIFLCDDVVDYTVSINGSPRTYIGASALMTALQVKSSAEFAAEPLTLVLDGSKIGQVGLPSVLAFYNTILSANFQQKRVNLRLALRDEATDATVVVWNLYAGKINNIRQVDNPVVRAGDGSPTKSNLEIVLDSLAGRYNRATFRTRTDEDQREIDPTDAFYSFTPSAVQAERSIYWGRAAPNGATGYTYGGLPWGGSGGGGYNPNVDIV